MQGDGDGWVVGDDGSKHWGLHGAAGLLLRAPGPDGTSLVLLQHRAAWSHQGGTWALPGGARDSHESPADAAVREAWEEAGVESGDLVVRTERVTARASSGWTYTTVLAEAAEALATVGNHESTELRWVPESSVHTLQLHPGFASSWPSLRSVPVHLVLDSDSVDTSAEQVRRLLELPSGDFGWVQRVITAPAGSELVEAASVGAREASDTVVVISADTALGRCLPGGVELLGPAAI